MFAKVDYKYMDDPVTDDPKCLRTMFNVMSVDTANGYATIKVFEDGRQKKLILPMNNLRYLFITPGDMEDKTNDS